MNEGNNKNSLSTISLIVGHIIQATLVIGGLLQFYISQKNLRKHDAEQRIEERKMDIYFRIGESVGAILSHNEIDSSLQKDVRQFYGLYYGEAALLDDSMVIKKMKEFRFATEYYLAGSYGNNGKFYFNEKGIALEDTLRASLRRIVAARKNSE